MGTLCVTQIGEDLLHALIVRAIFNAHCLLVRQICVSYDVFFGGEATLYSYCVKKLFTSVLFTAICPGICRRPDFMSICADDKCAKGECEDHDGNKSCNCYAGWTGQTCETGKFSTGLLFVKT